MNKSCHIPPTMRLCGMYCATWQGSLDWFEVDLSARPASSFGVMRILSIVQMGWLWLVDSLKLHVSFEEYGLYYRARLHQRPTVSICVLYI